MKNFTRSLYMSFIVLMLSVTFAPESMALSTIVTESFENGGAVPAGWTTEVVSGGNTISFVTSTSWPAGYTAYNGTYMVLFNSFSASGGVNRLKMATPVSTLGYSRATVDFAWLESSGYAGVLDRVDVQWSTDGVIWNTAGTFNRYNAVDGWKIKSQLLPAGAQGQSALYISFLFTSAYGNDCYLDFAHITAEEAPGMITVGTGTVSCNYPYPTYWMGGRTQLLYTSAQLAAAGALPGSITCIGFNVYSYSNMPMSQFKVRIGNTALTTLAGWETLDMQECYSGTYAVPGNGWQMINLQTPFLYDGTNMIVEICFANTTYSNYSYVYGTTAPAGQIKPYWMDNTDGCSYTGLSYTGYTGLPNLRFFEEVLSPGTITVGTGTVGCNYPYSTYWMGGRTQLLYTSAQLAAAGASPGLISSIGFNVFSYSNMPMSQFKVRIGNTALTTLTGWETDGMQDCYTGTYTVPGIGWQMIPLQTPFLYDGTNLIVEICFANATYTSYSYVYGTTAPPGQIMPYWMDNTDGCSYTGASYTGYTGLPNLRIEEEPYYTGPLPFCEHWDGGSFITNHWQSGSSGRGNWTINGGTGNPAPSADFSGQPVNTNYSFSLESAAIDATPWTCADLWLDFDYKLEDLNMTSAEKLTVEIYTGSSWYQKVEFVNNGNVDWIRQHINISEAKGHRLRVRFRATGVNSGDIQHWYVDNICVSGVCNPPSALAYTQNGLSTNLTWNAPPCVSGTPTNFIFDDGSPENGWGINPGYNAWIGNEFPVSPTTQGVIKKAKFYFWNNPAHGTDQLTIDFFDASHTLIGSTSPFTVPNDAWDSIPVPDILFTGSFYAMIHWNWISASTNWVGYDENGPYSAQNLETYYDGTTWSKLTTSAGANPGVCMIRLFALVNGALKAVELVPGQTLTGKADPAALNEGGRSGDTGDHQAMGIVPANPSGGDTLIGYNVYRTSGILGTGPFGLINPTPLSSTTYIDTYPPSTPPGSIFRYYVTDIFNKSPDNTFLCESSSDTIIVTRTCAINSLPFNEVFGSTSIPPCWTQIDHQGSGQVWQFGRILGYDPAPALTGNYAFLNSNAYGNGHTQNADLVSPLMDLSAYTTVTLEFKHYFRSSSALARVSYSIDNGSTWITIQTFALTTANPAIFSRTIPVLAGRSQVKFKWNYTGSWDWYWAIDDILVSSVPSGRELTDITIGSGITSCYNATQTITVAGNGTNFSVRNGGDVTLIAGRNILLLPGTMVESGGHLWGYITSTGNYCVNPSAPVNETPDTKETETVSETQTTLFRVYPNPTTGKFTLELNGDLKDNQATVRIYGMMGEEVLQENLDGKTKTEFSLSNRSNGIYIIQVMMGNRTATAKIIKQ